VQKVDVSCISNARKLQPWPNLSVICVLTVYPICTGFYFWNAKALLLRRRIFYAEMHVDHCVCSFHCDQNALKTSLLKHERRYRRRVFCARPWPLDSTSDRSRCFPRLLQQWHQHIVTVQAVELLKLFRPTLSILIRICVFKSMCVCVFVFLQKQWSFGAFEMKIAEHTRCDQTQNIFFCVFPNLIVLMKFMGKRDFYPRSVRFRAKNHISVQKKLKKNSYGSQNCT